MSSSPQVSRSYSYPLEAPWHPMEDSRKGSIDDNPPSLSLTPSPSLDTTQEIPNPYNNDNGRNSTGSSSDTMVPPRAKHGKSIVDDAKMKKSWRASGSVVQQKLVSWKPEEPLDISHLNLESIPKPILKGDHYLSLKHLNLSYNKLTSLPSQITQLKLLVTIDCTFNRLTDLPVELGDLLSLESLQLSGNPLNKELMQRHLLGTVAVLQYLKERQASELGRARKSNKFKGLKSTSDPDYSKPRSSSDPADVPKAHESPLPRALLTPSLISPPSSSPILSPADYSGNSSPAASPRNPLSISSDNSIHKNKPLAITRQRSGPPPQPQHIPARTPSPLPHVYSPSPQLIPPTSPSARAPTPPPRSQTPPPTDPRGDMGPIVTQLKFGIIYTETIKSLTVTSPEPPSRQQKPAANVSENRGEDYTHNYNGVSALIPSGSHGTKEKFILRDGEGRFTFNTYCTVSFLELRNLSQVPQDRYLAALESISALGFAGKSGAVLLKSADGLLVLKTISKDEAKFLRKIMPQFLAYTHANPKTYLTRFWGLYKVIRSPIEKVNFVVMKNAFFTTKKIHERYDLKGSTVGRTTDEENVRRSRVVLKDLNFNRQLKLGSERSKVFLAQLDKDTEFLQKFDIIDYSLIVGVHYLSEPPTKDPMKDYPIEGEIQAMDKEGQLLDEVYFMNIIDMLQPFNMRKQMEYGFKSLRYGSGISVVPPENYAARFLAFIQSVVE